MNESINPELEKAAAYFQNEAKWASFHNGEKWIELPPILKEMKKIGAERDPEHFHVLVHPSYAFDKAWMEANIKKGEHSQQQILEWALKYFGLVLNSIIDQPESTIIISDSSEVALGITNFHDRIIHTTGGRAHLSPQELTEFFQLTKGINPRDSFRIHGSIWKYCTTGFATQLHIATQLDGYIGKQRRGYVGAGWDAIDDRNMSLAVKSSDAIRNGQILFGVQHNTALLSERDDQFMDENSVIIPSPEEVAALKKDLGIK
jgi:hypothetical protein